MFEDRCMVKETSAAMSHHANSMESHLEVSRKLAYAFISE